MIKFHTAGYFENRNRGKGNIRTGQFEVDTSMLDGTMSEKCPAGL
ncbi:hypothetical protein AAG747_27795 [Rapidithrix thailandica]|uniref:Uncharacterized protein n=1 Tax=Rapidithrix thailandica TaxID=413964 RepID=A0AAW9SLX1_9BACT